MATELSLHQRRRPPNQRELDAIPWLNTLEGKVHQRAVNDMVVTDANAGDFVCRIGRPVTYWFGLIEGLLNQ